MMSIQLNDQNRAMLAYLLGPLLLLLFFVNKPFQLDDGVFLNIGDRLPWTWFGADGVATPFNGTYFLNLSPYESTHPPLIPYLLKWIGLLSDTAAPSFVIYHLVFWMFPLMTLVWAVKLARQFDLHPCWAALLVIAPSYFVNATSLMTDVPFVAFLLGWFYYAVRLDRDGGWRCGLGFTILGLLATLVAYQALAFLVLLAFIWLLGRRWSALVWLALLLGIFGLYLGVIYWTSGFLPFFTHTAAHNIRGLVDQGSAAHLLLPKVFALGIHLGFGLLVATPWLFSKLSEKSLLVLVSLAVLMTMVFVESLSETAWMMRYQSSHVVLLKSLFFLGILWVLYALSLLPKSLLELGRGNKGAGYLCFCLLAFLAVVGYNLVIMPYVNSRYILPALPFGLIALFMDHKNPFAGGARAVWFVLMLCFACLCARVDWLRADLDWRVYQSVARQIEDPRELWYCDDHGLGRYLETMGARYFAHDRYVPQAGDYVLSCRHITMQPDHVRLVRRFRQRAFAGLVLHQPNAGAGFYASTDGLLPISFGADLHQYELWQVVP